MNSRLFTITALATVNVLAQTTDGIADYEDIMAEKHAILDRKLLEFDAMRGLWIGFNRGLYQHSATREMEKHCMNEDGRSNFTEFFSVYLGIDDIPDTVDGLSALGDFIKFWANLTTCEWRKPLRDLEAFCNAPQERDPLTPSEISDDAVPVGDVKPCAFPTVMDNYTKNAFILMGKGSQMAEMWKEFPAEDPEMALSQALTLGEDLGTFARMGLNFVAV